MVAEKDKLLFEFFANFETVNIVLSVFVNILLIYLILYRSPKEIGAYKYLLLAFALNDIYYPFIHILTLPVICSYKDAFIMFSYGIFTSKASICLYACTFSQTMPLLAQLFVYRLIAAKWPQYIKYYTATSCFFVVMISVSAVTVLWFANCYINYGLDQETLEYAQPFLDDEFRGEKIEFIGALYYSVEGKFRMRAFLATMGFNTIMMTCMSVIAFCSFSIIIHFRSDLVQWSAKTKKLQLQLFKTLVVQMIVPMVFVYLPCAGIINLPMMGFRLNVFPNLVSASTTFFPLVDAFIIIFGVKNYRESITTMFICCGRIRRIVIPLSTQNFNANTTMFVRNAV